MLRSECCFISGACNTVADGVVWFPHSNNTATSSELNSLLAFPTSNLVSIVRPDNPAKLICTLKGHLGNINAVSCLQTTPQKVEIVSAGEDKSIRLWRHRCPSKSQSESDVCLNCNAVDWECVVEPELDMDSSVTAVSSLCAGRCSVIVASTATGNVRIWCRLEGAEDQSFHLIESTILPPSQIANRLHLTELPTYQGGELAGAIMLLIGAVDARIHIWTATERELVERTSILCRSNEVQTTMSLFHVAGALSGHEEWVTCFSTVMLSQNCCLIASGSQDCKVRLWRVDQISSQSLALVPAQNVGDDSNEPISDEDEDELEVGEISTNVGKLVDASDDELAESRLQFQIDAIGSSQVACRYAVYLEALLIGHEDWVTTVGWLPRLPVDSSLVSHTNNYRLFSASMDRNMVIWCPDILSGVWMPTVRVGDIGGMLGGSVGANLLGFVGGCVSPCGRSLLGVGYGGSLHLWSKSRVEAMPETIYTPVKRKELEDNEKWEPRPFLTGHFGAVMDCVWSAEGSTLVTVSSDQTCRVFAEACTGDLGVLRWCEISRPMVHGYDLTCIVSLPVVSPDSLISYPIAPGDEQCANRSPFAIVVGGDEKVIRVFDAPQIIIDGLATLCNVSCAQCERFPNQRILRAFLPELGLTSKAAVLMTDQEQAEQLARNVRTIEWKEPPLECQLSDHTIWPELKKLFGHPNDITALAVTSDGRVLASACKTKDASKAAILFWDMSSMTLKGSITCHQSTVVCLRFSPDDRYLISTGKDRNLCLHRRVQLLNEKDLQYELLAVHKSVHKRIIWDACWFPNSRILATASRDGQCSLWTLDSLDDSDISLCLWSSFMPFDGVSVTAVALTSLTQLVDERTSILAVGSETGKIRCFTITVGDSTIVQQPELLDIAPFSYWQEHGGQIRRLRFNESKSGSESIKLASVSDDHTVRIFSFCKVL